MKAKKAFLLIIAILLIPMLTACGVKVDDVYEPDLNEEAFRKTVLYFMNDDGFIVPVMKLIPWEEGIGKAALYNLVGTEANNTELAMNGLKAVIPDGVKFELRISDKHAVLNIVNLPKLPDAKTEKALIETVVNTLCEFPTIDRVSLMFDGNKVSRLENGTAVPDKMSRILLNVENEELPVFADSVKAEYVTIYFPNNSYAQQVPINRRVENKTLLNALEEMLKGANSPALKNCFPEGTSVLSAEIIDGVCKVDFSEEFSALGETSDGAVEALYNSIYLTAMQFGEVKELKLYVDGEPFITDSFTVSAPLYPNVFK